MRKTKVKSTMFLFICAVLVCILNKSQSEEYKFKVLAPEYACNEQNNSQTTIRLVGEDVGKLEYNLTVGFKFLNSGGSKQRNVLMVWRSVRNLEKSMRKMATTDMNRGIVHINNTMLTPGIKYEFNLTARAKNNPTIDQRQFSFEVISNRSEISTMSAYVTGPDVTYADVNYIAQVDISSCADNPDYTLAWQLLDTNERIMHEEGTKSRILKLAPHSLASGKSYTLHCLVLDNETGENKTSSGLRITVLRRGMQLNTYMKYLKIGVRQPICLNAYFNDPDCIEAELTFEWTCIDSGTDKDCAPFDSTNGTQLVIPEGLATAGSYLFTAKAIKNTTAVSATTRVEVVEETLPVLAVENAITSCNPREGLQISAHVSQLIVGCTLQWISVRDIPEYSYIDLTLVVNRNTLGVFQPQTRTVAGTDLLSNNQCIVYRGNPGEPGKLIEITDDEEELQEVAEYNNNTIDKQHDLILTVPNESWNGLNSSSKYLFRLVATCPCSENNSSDNGSAVTASVDVEVTTNSSPVMQILNVDPTSGESLRTIYTYFTELPSNCSNPLSYKFGYVNDNEKIVYVVQQYDTSTAETVLPFNAEPMQTILEVCDSRNACNSTLGPKVTVTLPINFTDAETRSFINRFNRSISEQDYFSAFTLASIVLKTTSEMIPNNTFNVFGENVKNITRNELDSMLNTTDDSWRQPAASFLKNIKILADEIHLPDAILDAVLGLRDRLSEKQNGQRAVAEKLRTRKLLWADKKSSERIINGVNMDEVKDYLEISELAIKRLKDYERVEREKEKLREKLENYMPQICQFLYKNYKTDVRVELSTLIFVVEKINLVRKYNEFIFVPYEINSAGKILLGRDIADRHKRQNGVCIGKIFFVDDYFHIPQYVYNVELYTSAEEEHLDTDLENYGIIIEMPVKSPVSNDQHLQCVLWEGSQWNFNKCKTLEATQTRVRCVCKSLGYFSIVPIERTTTVTTAATVSTLKTTAKMSLQNSVRAEAVTSELSPVVTQAPTNHSAKYQIDEKHSNTGAKNIKSAAIWSITIMSIGILSLLVAFVILFKRLKRTDVIQNFQTIEYAKYFDEQNME